MSGDEADFQSSLKDLESFVKLLSPIGAQLQETLDVDSAQRIDYDEPQELVISEIGVHTKSNMTTMECAVNQLKISLWIQVLSFLRTSEELKGQRGTLMHMLWQ